MKLGKLQAAFHDKCKEIKVFHKDQDISNRVTSLDLVSIDGDMESLFPGIEWSDEDE